MVKELLDEGGIEVVWATIWRNNYGSVRASRDRSGFDQPHIFLYFFCHFNMVFVPIVQLFGPYNPKNQKNLMRRAGPDAPPPSGLSPSPTPPPPQAMKPLTFQFSPRVNHLVDPPIDQLPVGSDAWALQHNMACVTPLRAVFAEPGVHSMGLADESLEGVDEGQRRIFKL